MHTYIHSTHTHAHIYTQTNFSHIKLVQLYKVIYLRNQNFILNSMCMYNACYILELCGLQGSNSGHQVLLLTVLSQYLNGNPTVLMYFT